MSHSFKSAYWNGECLFSEEQQQLYWLRKLSEEPQDASGSQDDSLAELMKDLNAR
jgi:hypothetical protein